MFLQYLVLGAQNRVPKVVQKGVILDPILGDFGPYFRVIFDPILGDFGPYFRVILDPKKGHFWTPFWPPF